MRLAQVAVDNANGLSLLLQHVVALEQKMEYYGIAVAVFGGVLLIFLLLQWSQRPLCPAGVRCPYCGRDPVETQGGVALPWWTRVKLEWREVRDEWTRARRGW